MKTYLILYCNTAEIGLPFAVWQIEATSFADAIRQWDKTRNANWKAYQITLI
jgi:hypothetical protein